MRHYTLKIFFFFVEPCFNFRLLSLPGLIEVLAVFILYSCMQGFGFYSLYHGNLYITKIKTKNKNENENKNMRSARAALKEWHGESCLKNPW